MSKTRKMDYEYSDYGTDIQKRAIKCGARFDRELRHNREYHEPIIEKYPSKNPTRKMAPKK